MPVELGIVIVNYQVRKLLSNCLDSIYRSNAVESLRVVVVDNGSTDGSSEMVRDQFPQVELISLVDNPGYPIANNAGIRHILESKDNGPAYILILNPDTELEPETIRHSLDFMSNNPDVGIMGPRLFLPNGSLDHACRRGFPTPFASFTYMTGLGKLFPNSKTLNAYTLSYLSEDEQADVDSVVGAFMMVRVSALEQTGLFDERFWMYGEDLDLAKRFAEKGWRTVYNPAVRTLHVKRASSRQNPRTKLEFYRAMLIFYYKHYRSSTSLPLHLIVISGLFLKGRASLLPTYKNRHSFADNIDQPVRQSLS